MAATAAIKAAGTKIAQVIGGTASSAFNAVFQERMTLAWVSSYKDEKGVEYTTGAITKSSRRIEIASLTQAGGNRTEDVAFTDARNTIVHELGHAFASLWYRGNDTYDPDGPYGTTHPIDPNYIDDRGFAESPGTAQRTWRQHPCTAANYSYCKNEVFADQFLGWTFGQWADDEEGVGVWRRDYMATNMVEWIWVASKR